MGRCSRGGSIFNAFCGRAVLVCLFSATSLFIVYDGYSPELLTNYIIIAQRAVRLSSQTFTTSQAPVQPESTTLSEDVAGTSETPLQTSGPLGLELVVALFCEDFHWILDTQRKERIPISVYTKDPACRKKLDAALRSSSQEDGKIRVESLPNVGREGHSYIRYILDSYDRLPEYVAFAQGAGVHNGVSVTSQLHEFIERQDRSELLVPMVHSNKQGYLLYRDADAYDPPSMYNRLDPATNLHIFQYFDNLDMANRARALYIALFGGSACDAPPMVFMAGAQFIVRRDAIRSRPKTFWQFLYDELASCFVLGWDFERLWVHVLNKTRVALDAPGRPGYCSKKRIWKVWNCTRYQEQPGVLLRRPDSDNKKSDPLV